MIDKSLTTSWMWAHENGVQGARLDLDAGKLYWYDNPGCACGDSSREQPTADFLEKGARWSDPPQDVLDEIRAALARVNQ